MAEEEKKVQQVKPVESKSGDGYLKLSLIALIVSVLTSIVLYNQNSTVVEVPVREVVVETATVTVESTVTTEKVLWETEVVTEKSTVMSVITETKSPVTKTVSVGDIEGRSARPQANDDADLKSPVRVPFVEDNRMFQVVRPDDYQMPASDISQGVIHPEDDGIRENATFVTLCRNSDLYSLVKTIRDVEDRFNHRYHYDWVFLNEVEFDDEFKETVTAMVSGQVKFGLIPEEHWSEPDFLDQDKFEETRDMMFDNEVLYGESVSYRHMCRFQAGFIYKQELLQDYDYYWRVDADVNIFCNIPYDIFKFMRVNKKTYGFILSLTEYDNTIPSLWKHVREFIDEHPDYLDENNLMDFISDDDGETFNGCHFWSNFEVGDLNFFRSKEYEEFFTHLDETGNFFYERWGDAPIHSLAASLFLDKAEVHFFDGLGFYHPDFLSCPVEQSIRLQNKCSCNPENDSTWWSFYICNRQYMRSGEYDLPPDVFEV